MGFYVRFQFDKDKKIGISVDLFSGANLLLKINICSS